MKKVNTEGLRSMPYLVVLPILILLVFFIGNPLVIIPSGFVGVKMTLGKIDPTPMWEGLHLRIPIVQSVEKVEIRTRAVEFTREKNNPISSLSKDGLPVNMDVAVLYRVDGKKAPELLREYGPDYEEKLIKQIVRTSVRDAIAEMESSVVYQERTKLQEKIKRGKTWMGK